MATANFDMNRLATMAITHRHPDGRIVLTVTDTVDVVTLILDDHGLAQVHRETGPDRSCEESPLHLVEVKG